MFSFRIEAGGGEPRRCKKAEARVKKHREAFEVSDPAAVEAGSLVDDVFTTGSTVEGCPGTPSQGAADVAVLTATRPCPASWEVLSRRKKSLPEAARPAGRHRRQGHDRSQWMAEHPPRRTCRCLAQASGSATFSSWLSTRTVPSGPSEAEQACRRTGGGFRRGGPRVGGLCHLLMTNPSSLHRALQPDILVKGGTGRPTIVVGGCRPLQGW